MAFGSRRLAGIWFSWQAPRPTKFTVFAGHPEDPKTPTGTKGLRANPPLAAVSPVDGSTWPAVIARVVAGSKTVPRGNERPKPSVTVPDCPLIRSLKSVYPLLRSAVVGTEEVKIV